MLESQNEVLAVPSPGRALFAHLAAVPEHILLHNPPALVDQDCAHH